ncbi:MAG: CpaD family pilus assembly lipoprotein [Pseudomonadota bacterium]
MAYLRACFAILFCALAVACAGVEENYETITPNQYLDLAPSAQRMAIPEAVLAAGGDDLFDAVKTIADAYNRHGGNRLHLIVATETSETRERYARILRMAFQDAGIRPDRMVITGVAVEPYGAVATFRRLDVVLPNCPDVMQANSPLGCALDKQIGRMAARPADLAGNDRLETSGTQPGVLAVERVRSQTPPPPPQSIILQTTDAAR